MRKFRAVFLVRDEEWENRRYVVEVEAENHRAGVLAAYDKFDAYFTPSFEGAKPGYERVLDVRVEDVEDDNRLSGLHVIRD